MNLDIYEKISKTLCIRDIANLSIAIQDQTIIRRKKNELFDQILAKRMKAFWMGRLLCLLRVFNNTSFWYKYQPGVFSVSFDKKHDFCKSFVGWDVDACGDKLYASTRILGQIISITVRLYSPFHSVRIGDDIRFKFDIIHTSIPLDVDEYAPTGDCSRVLVAMYESLNMKTEQFGVYTLGGVEWTKFVTIPEMEAKYGEILSDGWVCNDGTFSKKIFDDTYVDAKFLGTLAIREKNQMSRISITAHGYTYFGSMPSSESYGTKGTMTRKCVKILAGLHEYYPLYPVRMHLKYKIRIQVNGEVHFFPSWEELKDVSGMSERKLKSMAVRENLGVFVDFDANTYKKRPISFRVRE